MTFVDQATFPAGGIPDLYSAIAASRGNLGSIGRPSDCEDSTCLIPRFVNGVDPMAMTSVGKIKLLACSIPDLHGPIVAARCDACVIRRPSHRRDKPRMAPIGKQASFVQRDNQRKEQLLCGVCVLLADAVMVSDGLCVQSSLF